MEPNFDGLGRRNVLLSALSGGIVGATGVVVADRSLSNEPGDGSRSLEIQDGRHLLDLPEGNRDVTNAVQSALDEIGMAGGAVEVPPRAEPYVLAGSLTLRSRQVLSLPAGVTLRRPKGAGSGPLINLVGKFAEVRGPGLIKSDNSSPKGLILVGPRTLTSWSRAGAIKRGETLLRLRKGSFTEADVGHIVVVNGAGKDGRRHSTDIVDVLSPKVARLRDPAERSVHDHTVFWGVDAVVGWSTVSRVRIRGNGDAISKGIRVNSSPQGGNGLTFGATISHCHIERVGTAVHLGPNANGNSIYNLQTQKIGRFVLDLHAAHENFTVGGFVTRSEDLNAIVRLSASSKNVFRGVMGEPGGVSPRAYIVDVPSRRNSLDIQGNVPALSIDRGALNASRPNW